MKTSQAARLMVTICMITMMISACNMPERGGSVGGVPLPTLDEEEQEWLGEEKPTPTAQGGKVGSGTVEISSLVTGLGADLEFHTEVPFTFYRTQEGAYQIIGSSNKGTMRLDLEGTGCVCDGDYEVHSEINGTILVANTGECKIEFSEVRTMGSGDCECDCPTESMSCEDAFPDIEDIDPFIVPFENDARHYESGENNGINFDYMWVFKDLKFESTDCFFPEVIDSTP
ncbi:MAG: hypothetical protein JW757_11390 [Anaerolineales bacterium]|nr:hypothetical protein [Anaerolineales bacterium]